MSDPIDGLNLSTSFFQEALRTALKTDLTPICTGVKRLDEGLGYLSVIAQLKLTWHPSHDDMLPDSVVVKIPTSEKIELELDRLTQNTDAEAPPFDNFMFVVHNAECKFYSKLAETLAATVPLPRIYSTKMFECTTEVRPKDFGLIVMEDFVGRGRSPDFFTETFNVAQTESLIDAIASIHAHSLINPDWNSEKTFETMDPAKFVQFAQLLKGGLTSLRSQFPQYFTVSDWEIDQIGDTKEIVDLMTTNLDKADYFPVLVHGDLWTNNTIFATDENNKVTDQLLAIIDWQGSHPGPVTEDFTRLMTSSVDPELRRANTDRWLQLYYKLLGEKLPKGYQIPFGMDEVMRMYKRTLRTNTLIVSIQIVVMINPSQSERKYTDEQKINLVIRLQKSIEDAIASLN